MKRSEAVLLTALFLDLAGFGMAFPDIALRARHFGGAGWQVGLIFASLFITQFIVSPWWGRLSDRIGRKPVLVICTCISSLSMIAYALATGLAGIALSRILAGLAAANVIVAQAYLADSTTDERRGAAMGRIGAAISAGLITGPALGGAIAEKGGSQMLGWVAASASALGAVLLLAGLRGLRPTADRAPGKAPILDFRLLREFPSLRGLYFLAAFAWFALACLEGTFAPLIEGRFVFPIGFLGLELESARSAAGLIFALESLIGVIVQGVLYSRISKLADTASLLRAGYLLQGVGLLLTPFAPVLGVLILFSATYSLGAGLAGPTVSAAASSVTPAERQGEMFGLLQGSRSIGFWLGPIVGNVMFDWHPAAPYALAGVVGVAAAALVPATLLRSRSVAEPGQA
jgi:MFS family permease